MRLAFSQANNFLIYEQSRLVNVIEEKKEIYSKIDLQSQQTVRNFKALVFKLLIQIS